MCSTPRCARARPTCVGWPRSTFATGFVCAKIMTSAISIKAQRETVLPEWRQKSPGTSKPYLLPRPGTPSKSRSWRRPWSPPDRAAALPPTTRAARHPGATSCREGSTRAARPLPTVRAAACRFRPAAGSGFAGKSSSGCSSRRTGGRGPGAPWKCQRREAIEARPIRMLDDFPIRISRQHALARDLANPAVSPAGRPPRLPRRSGGTNDGTSAPPRPATRPLPIGSSFDASQRPNTSTNFSIRVPCRASVRRILPTSRLGTDLPDRSCAT